MGFEGFEGFERFEGVVGLEGFERFERFEGFEGVVGFEGFERFEGFEGGVGGKQPFELFASPGRDQREQLLLTSLNPSPSVRLCHQLYRSSRAAISTERWCCFM